MPQQSILTNGGILLPDSSRVGDKCSISENSINGKKGETKEYTWDGKAWVVTKVYF